MRSEGEGERVPGGLRFGQVFTGTVVRVPRPGAIGVFVDLGLGAPGFVDVLLLPHRSEDWPVEGTVTDFEVWWVHGDHQQIRLKPADPRYLSEDFAAFVEQFRPRWPTDIGTAAGEPGTGPHDRTGS